jgi:CRISPR-associated endoribonuclease Cas6
MLQASGKLLEFTTVYCTLDEALDLRHARWLRGAVARQVGRPEFHHHAGKGFVYQHPLIRYDVSGNQALMLGLAEGAFLLRSLPQLKILRLGTSTHRVLSQSTEASRVEIGPCDEPIIYRFLSPFLALNQENYPVWNGGDLFTRRRLLQRVAVGNLLSLSKAINLNVTTELHAEVELAPDGWHDLKPGVQLLGFRGLVQVNFRLPDHWGIGKSSARGFGTLVREEA